MGYVDTSLLAAYYCPEPLSAAAQARLGRLASPAISPLVEVELYSAVSQKVRMGELDVASGSRILSLFQLHQGDGYYRLVTLGADEYSLSRDWIGRFSTPLRTLDALHLAAAFANRLTILTADTGLARSAALLGIDHELVT